MKICAISDMHGHYDFNIDPIDILFICGDIMPLYIQRNKELSIKWIRDFFIPWCNDIECKQIYLIAGNHDFAFENNDKVINELFLGTKIIYLNNQYAEYFDDENNKIYKIWGSPLCSIFYNWAFMKDEEYEYEQFMKMPDDCDFLITHDAPYGVSDICYQGLTQDHLGNKALRKAIIEKNPKYNFHGHLHSSNHNNEILNNTKVYNVSMINESYDLEYYPLYIEI